MLLPNNRCFLLLFIQLIFPISVTGQIKSVKKERNTDLSFSTGVNVSLRGTKVFNEFKLTDDLGFDYDIMSVLKNDDIRSELGVTDRQYESMKSIQKAMTDELVPQAVSGAANKEIGRQMEAKVKATELILQNSLDDKQMSRLVQIKNQLRFERYGAAAIAGSRFLEKEWNVSTELAQSIRNKVKTLKESNVAKARQLYEEANEKVINSLPPKQLKKFKGSASEEFRRKYMCQPLFKEKPKRRFRRVPSDVSFLQLLSSKEVRNSIELVDHQYEDIIELKKEFDEKLKSQADELLSGSGKTLSISQRGKQLAKLNAANKREFEVKLRTSLLDHQLNRLIEIAIEMETGRHGTVQCLCNGSISERIEFSEADAKKAYDRAVEINKGLQVRLERLDRDLHERAMKLIPKFDVAEKMGNPVKFKLR